MIHLSKRLQTVVSLVSPGNRTADVGCDHAHTGIYLVQAGISPKVLAMDLRKGPLEKARENVLEAGLKERIDLRLSDGLDALGEDEVDTILISGMGGPLILEILERNLEKAKSVKELVLSPQSDLPEFRKGLENMGFIITDIRIVRDDKYYFIFKAVPAQSRDKDDPPAPTPTTVWLEYLEDEIKNKEKILKKIKTDDGEKAVARRDEIYNEIRRIEDEINRMRNRKGI
jgi:tRNA (adenine22-N1)-methyltransferase